MVKVSITQTGSGKCALSGYDGEGLTAAFDGDQPLFLTWRSFKELLALRLAQGASRRPPRRSGRRPRCRPARRSDVTPHGRASRPTDGAIRTLFEVGSC